MKFKTDFLLEDYANLCWFQAKTATMILAVLLALAFGGIAAAITQVLVIGMAVLVVLIPLSYFIQKRSVKKRAERRFLAFGASSELSLEINDDEILQYSNSGETRLPWEDVYAVREGKDCYYVFLTKRKAFYFPKRSFESDAHKEEFLGYISKHVDEKKIKLKKEA